MSEQNGEGGLQYWRWSRSCGHLVGMGVGEGRVMLRGEAFKKEGGC